MWSRRSYSSTARTACAAATSWPHSNASGEVVICEILSGDFDIMVRLEAASLERVRSIWEDIAQMPGVRDTVTALTLSSVVNRSRGEGSSTAPG
ncbi:Lrp/AsnC ligand binding domain-containing protein [Streptomyces griseus]|uniref:Lrp/AsnC ligand binding domain-containing protein n=1 Tax=Streptomyces griseus TaxID=1911 RepID=UPI001F37FAB0|nr:Lrp/AsnC ligand binding domain-containing protein [Streptomyces griseus]